MKVFIRTLVFIGSSLLFASALIQRSDKRNSGIYQVQLEDFHINDVNSSYPLYYGWFLDEQTANSLQAIKDIFFSSAYLNVSTFRYFIDIACEKEEIDNPFKYFKKPRDPNTGEFDPLYHITSKFCNREDCSPYSDHVKDFLNQTFKSHLVGLFITERTFGIRINLTEEQIPLFDNNKFSQMNNNKKEILTNERDYPGFTFLPQEQNFKPTTSKAHITLGCAPGVEAYVTGNDLINIIMLESDPGVAYLDFKINDGTQFASTLRQYFTREGETVFVFYPHNQMIIDTRFEEYL